MKSPTAKPRRSENCHLPPSSFHAKTIAAPKPSGQRGLQPTSQHERQRGDCNHRVGRSLKIGTKTHVESIVFKIVKPAQLNTEQASFNNPGNPR